MKKLIRYLFEEEDSSQCLKILSQFTVKKTKSTSRDSTPFVTEKTSDFFNKYLTLHRILMLKVKERARHAFTLKQKRIYFNTR